MHPQDSSCDFVYPDRIAFRIHNSYHKQITSHTNRSLMLSIPCATSKVSVRTDWRLRTVNVNRKQNTHYYVVGRETRFTLKNKILPLHNGNIAVAQFHSLKIHLGNWRECALMFKYSGWHNSLRRIIFSKSVDTSPVTILTKYYIVSQLTRISRD